MPDSLDRVVIFLFFRLNSRRLGGRIWRDDSAADGREKSSLFPALVLVSDDRVGLGVRSSRMSARYRRSATPF